ncbi:hypothetical protein MMC13_004086 [Lambiella insularis]|nr:hypothetical protein [Lambiella insularis]
MPSPATPRRTSNRRDRKTTPAKPKSVDVGSPLGPYDTNTVRDRVRQWQSQGGGVITASDIYVEEDPERPDCKPATPTNAVKDTGPPKTPDAAEPKHSGVSARNGGRQKTKSDLDEHVRSKSGSAPKKRVVSDGHWRRKRNSSKTTGSPKTKTEPPSRVLADDGIRVIPISDYVQNSAPEDTKTARAKKRSFREGSKDRDTTPSSRRRSRHLQPPHDGYRSQSDASDRGVRSPTAATPTSSQHTPRGERIESNPEEYSPENELPAATDRFERRGSSQRQDVSSEKSPRSVQGTFPSNRDSNKSSKGYILSHVFDESRKMFSRAEPGIIPSPRIPSIEAWLSETPDPFMDEEQPPVEIPAPLRSTTSRKKEVVEVKVDDPNKIWEAIETNSKPRHSSTSSRKHRRVRSAALYEDNPFPESLVSRSPLDSSPIGGTAAAKLVDLVESTPDLSPPSLRRRGAKHSPSSSTTRERRKSSPLKESLTQDDVSVMSSANTASSVEPLDMSTPLRPPGLNLRRPFPSTGRHRLSTIASVETFNTKLQNTQVTSLPAMKDDAHKVDAEESPTYEALDSFDPNGLLRRPSKSRMAKHSDLISVLSLPMGRTGSIRSARSIRTNRSQLAKATLEDLLVELTTDEVKYMRELRTLVDGVIPVLLACVLSKSDSAVAAGLFSGSTDVKDDPNFTRPIIDMGIALERLKSLHKRMPLSDTDALLTWAHGAQKVYSEYLKAWRMGFQDVVVNLAASTDGPARKSGTTVAEDDGIEAGLPRNEDGDVVDANGERVDVAYLLKRPLVRLKYLAKTLKGINFVRPSSEAEALASKYQNLVMDARNRSNEERARLEDQAAANIDPTRARDPRTLGPLAGVAIDRRRRVRARDYFNLALHHSSGQKIDCRVELLIRDDAPGSGTGGDLLVCEVDGTGRWLLFPPVQFGRVSARNGDIEGEIIIMIRGLDGQGGEWHELLSLHTEDEPTGFEWVQMLGLEPIPPKVTRSQSFLARHGRRRTPPVAPAVGLGIPNLPSTPTKSRTPSPREIEIPIGEQPNSAAKKWIEAVDKNDQAHLPVSPTPKERSRLQKRLPGLPVNPVVQPNTNSPPMNNALETLPNHRRRKSEVMIDGTTHSPRSLNEALQLAGTSTSSLRRATANRHSKHVEDVSNPGSPKIPYPEDSLQRSSSPEVKSSHSEIPESVDCRAFSPTYDSRKGADSTPTKSNHKARPRYHRSLSSAPSLELPIIPKVRKDSPPPTPSCEPVNEPEWPASPAQQEAAIKSPTKLAKRRPVGTIATPDKPPSPPVHQSPSPAHVNPPQVPELSPVASRKGQRRSSSPLKHEYEPSTASESSSDSDASTVERNEATSVSDSSEDEELEDGDTPTPLIPLRALQRLPKTSPQGSLYSLPNGTLSPSNSASQAPFKRVPSQPSKASKTIASIFFWSDKGSWENLHPDECSVVVTPGLIEAFEMSAAHSQQENNEQNSKHEPNTPSSISKRSSSQASDPQCPRPLIALELTPLVPIRRGTALDISIRSPPTAESKITTTSNNNIMFRSRNPEECEALYALINHARINNPTYIALQNARVTSAFTPSFDRSNSTRGSRSTSWFGLGHGGKSSYRASSAPTPSISMSDSSIGSMSSAFSALKRFGMGGGRFSVARSTVTSRHGSRAGSVYTSSDNSSGSGASTPIPTGNLPTDDGKLVNPAGAGPIGLSNAKIRLYIRESASKWRDLGSARLTIMRPTNAAHPLLVPGATPQQKQGADDKRIVVIGKSKGETLLDVTLGESCFERVARTGIAVSVWEAFEGGLVAKVGGVVGGHLRVFMIQMKSEAETAYTFSIVGKLRY